MSFPSTPPEAIQNISILAVLFLDSSLHCSDNSTEIQSKVGLETTIETDHHDAPKMKHQSQSLETGPLHRKQPPIVGPDAIQPMFWHWLYNDGLMKYCALKSNCGLSRFSVIFTDGFCWLGEGQDGMKPCEQGEDIYEKGMDLPKTLRTLWTWHGRMGHENDECVDVGKNYLVGAIRRRINEVLKTGLVMGGRDLFPGPVVAS
jgi:hypothetical protein